MNTYTDAARSGGISSWLRRAEGWLDQRGKWAWIAAMVLGFVFFWPLGLALLAYMIWGKRMFRNSSCSQGRMAQSWKDSSASRHGTHYNSSGNTAFDAYKAEALRRLEEEQEAFEAFLQRLRSSKDKSQFDTFMEDRARANQAADAEAAAAPASTDGPRPGEY